MNPVGESARKVRGGLRRLALDLLGAADACHLPCFEAMGKLNLSRQVRRCVEPDVVLYEGVEEALESLKQKYVLGVITNGKCGYKENWDRSLL